MSGRVAGRAKLPLEGTNGDQRPPASAKRIRAGGQGTSQVGDPRNSLPVAGSVSSAMTIEEKDKLGILGPINLHREIIIAYSVQLQLAPWRCSGDQPRRSGPLDNHHHSY